MAVVLKPIFYATLAMTFIAHYAILVATGIPYWRKSNWQISDPLYGRIPTFDGIWWQCMSLKVGGFTCNNYGKPTYYIQAGIQACRGLMVVACITGFLGLIGNILCLDCTTVLPNGSNQKRILAIISGVNLLLAGLCTLGATSYYAWQITYQFYSPYYQEREFKYEFGACLYLAWIGMVLAFIAGGILACGSCRKNKDSYDPYQYRAPSKLSPSTFDNKAERTEYV